MWTVAYLALTGIFTWLAYDFGKLTERTRLKLEFEQAERLRLEAESTAREAQALSREIRGASRIIQMRPRAGKPPERLN